MQDNVTRKALREKKSSVGFSFDWNSEQGSEDVLFTFELPSDAYNLQGS